MKFLFDLFPVVLFFVAFKLFDIYVATAAAIVATIVQVAWLKLRGRHVDMMLWASLAIIVVFGGATLLLQDEMFIKWKPTVLYWLFGAVLAGSMLAFRKNLIRGLLSEQMELPEPVWARLNWSWVGFFVFMGALNLYVAFNYSTDLWVNFKVFGGIGLMVAFVVGQSLVLARHMQDPKQDPK
jgi:intracellular septation protein